ncbi:hypothetical protein OKW22_000468 [Bacilli bacterium PM5-3]|nr:hypothetical protein [Bacilli bacterium PM5-3]MDH6603748.1 hypothetical protein [Bacilli bacterium PM5-9]
MPNKKKFLIVLTLVVVGAIIYISEALIGIGMISK